MPRLEYIRLMKTFHIRHAMIQIQKRSRCSLSHLERRSRYKIDIAVTHPV